MIARTILAAAVALTMAGVLIATAARLF